MHSRATSEYTKVSFNIFVKFTQKYPSTASFNLNFFNFVKKWNFWNSISAFFRFSWRPTYGDFAKKKVRIYVLISIFFWWYLVFFLSNQFAPYNRPKKSPDIKKKVQISPKFLGFRAEFWHKTWLSGKRSQIYWHCKIFTRFNPVCTRPLTMLNSTKNGTKAQY